MALTVTQTPSTEENGFESKWVSVFNPINFSISNTKFPINQEDSTFLVVQYFNNNELLRLRLSQDADYIIGEVINLSNVNIESYNTTTRIVDVIDSRNIVVNLEYNNQLSGTSNVQKVFRDYETVLRVNAGLPVNHKWSSLKPFRDVGLTSARPDGNNTATTDIKDFVQETIKTDNDYNLGSLPNDINLWTSFSIEYAERYKGFEGDDPNITHPSTTVTDYADNNNLSQITLSQSIDLITGDYVRFGDFDDDGLNRRFRVIRIIDSNNIVINLDYSPYVTLNGAETATKYSSELKTITTEFEDLNDLFYAVNAKQDELSNMISLVNQLDNTDLADNTTTFKELYFRKDQPVDLAYIVDKDLTDRMSSTELLSIQRKAYDEQGNLLDTSYYYSNNEEEGVYRLDFNTNTPIPEIPLISFFTFENGDIPLFVENSDVGRWEVNGIVYNGNSVYVNVDPGDLVEYYAPDEANVTRIVLDECGITNNPVLDLSAFTNVNEFIGTDQNFRLKVGDWILQPNINIDTSNSILSKENYDYVQDQLITIAGGTLDTSGSSYTGNPGATFNNRTWEVGTVIFDLSASGDQITYEKFLALTTTNGGTGWGITTIKTLCLKDIDFFLGKDSSLQSSDYTIPVNYSIDRPSDSDVIQSVDLSGVVGGTFTIKLLTPDGNTQVASNLLQINNLLNTSDKTGFILRVGGISVGDSTFVTVTILDFPRALSICGSVDSAGRFSGAYLDLFFAGFVDPEGDNTLNQWNDISTGNNWKFPAPAATNRPTIVGESARFNRIQRQLKNNAAKSAWNFLHDGTEDYAVVFAADLSVSIGKFPITYVFQSSQLGTIQKGFVIINEQRFLDNSSGTITPCLRVGIFRGIAQTNVYDPFKSRVPVQQVINGMAIYTINVPLSSGGNLDVYYNSSLAYSTPRIDEPVAGDSTGNLTIGRPQGTSFGGNFGDLSDLVIIKNPTIAKINAIEQILADKNNITL